MFLDAQAVLPKSWFPNNVVNLVDWYTSPLGLGDPLMFQRPALDLSLMVSPHCDGRIAPTVTLFLRGFIHALSTSKLIAAPRASFGSHVMTTMIPILGHLAATNDVGIEKKTLLISVYAPYLLIPLWLVVAMLRGQPFGQRGDHEKKSS
eukprot:CAMPEP_0171691180 /NCGR_PEP_ID=MMETSP0991-20121206/5394_1 /TAXON_ID=483369 /ORGANISM="non described non described, Strain CCMP2098" /LENGTH=148 /DNA_ID=CAMNT_0012279377 /DNA_START=31 /DNA_END=481 /DNA_ORIENTATION=+